MKISKRDRVRGYRVIYLSIISWKHFHISKCRDSFCHSSRLPSNQRRLQHLLSVTHAVVIPPANFPQFLEEAQRDERVWPDHFQEALDLAYLAQILFQLLHCSSYEFIGIIGKSVTFGYVHGGSCDVSKHSLTVPLENLIRKCKKDLVR